MVTLDKIYIMINKINSTVEVIKSEMNHKPDHSEVMRYTDKKIKEHQSSCNFFKNEPSDTTKTNLKMAGLIMAGAGGSEALQRIIQNFIN